MSSEADVKRLVEAARNLIHLNEEGRKTASSFMSAKEWFNTQKRCEEELSITLDPFAAERDGKPVCRECNGQGGRHVGNHHDEHFEDCVACSGSGVANPPAPSPSVPTPEQLAERHIQSDENDPVAVLIKNKNEAYTLKYPNCLSSARRLLTTIITADRAAVTATLRAEVARLEKQLESALLNASATETALTGQASDYEARIAALEAKLAAENETQSLNDKLTGILTRTANALHGGPNPNGLWSWHDLPELAAKLADGGGVDNGTDKLWRHALRAKLEETCAERGWSINCNKIHTAAIVVINRLEYPDAALSAKEADRD